jgi:hypothetical protein
MRVLLTGTESCGIDRVERLLRAVGHEISSCTDESVGGRCREGAGTGICPTAAGVDVIVAARQHPLPHLTAREELTRCQRLVGVPLIVAGSTVLNPFGLRATACVEGFEDVPASVQVVMLARRRTSGREPSAR